MVHNKKLSLVMAAVMYIFAMTLSTAAYAEVLPQLPNSNLTGNFAAKFCGDDEFKVFLSTTPNIVENVNPTYTSDDYWMSIESFSANLSTTPQKYYILVSCLNTGGPGGIIGKFTLSGTGYKFANGTTTLYTDTVNWKVSKTGFAGSYSSPVLAYGNDHRYDDVNYSLDPSARWIWTTDGLYEVATRYFVAEIIPVDVTPPVITIGDYTKTPVNTDITVTATTNEGNLNVASHTFTANGSFDFVATDAAGNVTTKTVIIDNIDKTAPSVTSSLDGKTYKLNEIVNADWLSTDMNGVASELGTISKGDLIDTSSVGTKTFNITAVDNVGNSITKTITYYVVYVYGGIRQPINSDNSSIFKLGSTVPVKFQLKDYYGNVVTSAASVMPTISISKVSTTVTGTAGETELTEVAMAGDEFRFDTTDKQYVFILSTKSLTSGTYEINITINDCTEIVPVRISSK